MRRIALSGLVAAVAVLGCAVPVLAGSAGHAAVSTASTARAAGTASAASPWGEDAFGNQVSCASTTSCLAVGSGVSSRGLEVPAAESLHAGTWKAVSTVKVPGYSSDGSEPTGVSCKAATYCLAVGWYMGNGTTPYAVTWNGTTLTPTPKLPVPSGDSFGFPGAVSCPAVKSCVVFGSGPDPSASRGYPIIALFAETWNGSKWSFAATPLPAGEDPIIKSARCFSPTSCVLAGAIIPTNGPPSDRTPLLATWNGKTLTSMNPVVPAGFTQAEFQSVSCVTPTSCAAAGVDIKGTTESALNDESAFLDVTGGTGWNLTKWGGPSGTISTDLAGVSCVSRSNCVAAGQIATAKTSVAAALSWNGIKWSVTKVPGPGTGKVSIFYGISCPAAGNCTAVGETAKPTAGLGSQFAGHWNGSSWTLTAA